MAGLTSQQLNKILDINAKSVEIYLEVDSKYSEIIEDLEELKKLIENVSIENKEHVKEQYLHIERMKNLTDKLQEITDNNCKAIAKYNTEVMSNINKLEKDFTRQTYLFGGTIISVIIGAIIKFIIGV